MKVLKPQKTAKTTITPNRASKIIINRELDKYDNMVLFPEKVAKAKETLSHIDWNKFKELSKGKERKQA